MLMQDCYKLIKNHIKTLVFTILDISQSISSVNPSYLNITHANGFNEEKGVNKYLIFDSMELHSTEQNKELPKKHDDVFNGIRDKIQEINSNECDYEKDYTKIKFNSDDYLPLNKSLKFCLMTITIRSVFEEDGKLYPQVFLDDRIRQINNARMH